jgi:hypothetical protein
MPNVSLQANPAIEGLAKPALMRSRRPLHAPLFDVPPLHSQQLDPQLMLAALARGAALPKFGSGRLFRRPLERGRGGGAGA